jgi:F0F1-type ATP synthase membrane subunit b/b'
MPIFLRKFYIKRINKILEEREEVAEQRRDALEKRKNRKNSGR